MIFNKFLTFNLFCLLLIGIRADSTNRRHIPRQADSTRRTAPNPNATVISLTATKSSEEDDDDDNNPTNKDTNYGQLLLPPGYNKLEIPTLPDEKTVYVYVAIFIRTILEVDEKSEELVLDTDFGMRWVDWKIYEHLDNTSWKDALGNKTLDSEILKQIWKPDIFIDEMASIDRTSILSKLITLNFLGDTGTENKGDIVYTARTTLKLRCDMSFEYYPADTQTCEYFIRSYSYPASELELYWKPDVGIYLDDPSDPNFDLQISTVEPQKELKTLYIEEKFGNYRRGNYSALLFTIKARRKLSYHVVQTYLPSILLIFITWLCFLLPVEMVEARIGISMTTLLTLTAMFSAVREQSPSVSYTMAIDIWMVFCIFFVFLALLLFAFSYWMKSRLMREQEDAEKKRDELNGPNTVNNESTSKTTYHLIVEYSKRYAFWAFAVIFITFLIVYWGWLLHCSHYFDWTPHPDYNAAADVSEYDDDDDETNLYRYHETPKGPNDTLGFVYFSSQSEGNETNLTNVEIETTTNNIKME